MTANKFHTMSTVAAPQLENLSEHSGDASDVSRDHCNDVISAPAEALPVPSAEQHTDSSIRRL